MSLPDLFERADLLDRVAAIADLLEHPRHSIPAKGRAWLRSEMKAAHASLDGQHGERIQQVDEEIKR